MHGLFYMPAGTREGVAFLKCSRQVPLFLKCTRENLGGWLKPQEKRGSAQGLGRPPCPPVFLGPQQFAIIRTPFLCWRWRRMKRRRMWMLRPSSPLRTMTYPVHGRWQAAPRRGELTCCCEDVICRATRALDVAIPEDLGVPFSRFEEDMEVRSAPAQVPVLPDFKDLVCRLFHSLAAMHK